MAGTLVEFHNTSGSYSVQVCSNTSTHSLPFQPLGTFLDVRYNEICIHIPLSVSQHSSVSVHTGREQLGLFDPLSDVSI